MTPHNDMPEPFILPARSVYAAETFKLDVETVKMDMVANTFMRAPGEAVGTFALECAIDELADELGMDPIELRIRNEPEKDPTDRHCRSPRGIVEAWRDRRRAVRLGQAQRHAGARREGEWLVGMGCATGDLSYYRMPGGAARITLDPRRPRDGRSRRARDGHGHRDRPDAGRRRAARAADGAGASSTTATRLFPGVVLAGGSQQTARSARRSSPRSGRS